MSITTFDNIVRSALWSSYNNICFYCNKPLDWNDIHIDHIIPEYLNNSPDELNRVKIQYQLDEGFDLNALYNLVPTHSKCNLRKSGDMFSKNTSLYYLSLTEKTKTKIQSEIFKLKNRKNKGQILSKLQSALEIGLVDTTEVEKLLSLAHEANWNVKEVKLPYSLDFLDDAYDVFYLNQDYTSLYDKKLLFGGVFDFINVKNNEEKVKEISTLREWHEALNDGFYPASNTDLKLSATCVYLSDFLEMMKKAIMPKFSFISEPWIGIDHLDLLSPAIIQDFEGQLKVYLGNGTSVGDLVGKGLIKCTYSNNFTVSLELDGIETTITELFRADFDEDGIEDIYVHGWVRAIGGTMGLPFTCILSRRSKKHLLEIAAYT